MEAISGLQKILFPATRILTAISPSQPEVVCPASICPDLKVEGFRMEFRHNQQRKAAIPRANIENKPPALWLINFPKISSMHYKLTEF